MNAFAIGQQNLFFLNSYHKLHLQTKFSLSYSVHAQIFEWLSEENKRLLEETERLQKQLKIAEAKLATCQTNEKL